MTNLTTLQIFNAHLQISKFANFQFKIEIPLKETKIVLFSFKDDKKHLSVHI